MNQLTLIEVEGCYSSAQSPCIRHYPLQYYPRPTQPEEKVTSEGISEFDMIRNIETNRRTHFVTRIKL